MTRDERIRIQRALAARGYKVDNFVGQIDFEQRDGIRAEQAKAGSAPRWPSGRGVAGVAGKAGQVARGSSFRDAP